MLEELRCYRYLDSSGSFYFHDPIHNIATWECPSGYTIYDGLTSERVDEDSETQSLWSESSETFPSEVVQSEIPPSMSSPSILAEFQTDESSESCSSSFHLSLRSPRPSGFRKIKFSRRGRRGTLNDLVDASNSPSLSSPLEFDNDKRYIMHGMVEDREAFDFNTTMEPYVKLRKHGSFGKKRRARPTEVLAFSVSDMDIPILKGHDKGTEKQASQLWKLVVEYVQSKSEDIARIAVQVAEHQDLIDEAYLQCCKLVRGNPYQEMVCRGVDLLLALATLFASSRQFARLVRHTLAVKACDPNRMVATRANLAYMRYRSRHEDRKPPYGWIDRMLQDPQYMGCLFGSCLEEQMWMQRTTALTCPIPIFLPIVCGRIIALQAREKTNLFKGGVYKPEIDSLVEKVRRKQDPLEGTQLEDLVLFFKRWIIELGMPIVDCSFYKLIGTNDLEIIKWADSLPDLSRRTLMYIIGFLRYVCKLDLETEQGRRILSMVMGPVLLPAQGEFDMRAATEKGKVMVLTLIEHWDVSDVFPLSDEIRLPDTLFG